jgi:tetratricopeptide (TPR) repeat protein
LLDRNWKPAPLTSSPTSVLRYWLARLGLSLGVTLIFFAGGELALRLAGYGHPTDFFIPDDRPGWYRTNPWFTNTFFPPTFGLKPLNFRLPRQKPAGEFRVFVVGESAAMGVPEPGFGLAPQLRAQLRAAWPGRNVAVYNLGITAINSHAIVPIVRQAAEFSPDAFVIYMGNNEAVGPFGPSSVATQGVPSRALVRLDLFVRRSRIGQLVQRVVQRIGAAGGQAKEWRGMEMFARNTVPGRDPRLAAVYANFAGNLHEIVGLARDSGARVVLSTVAVNVRDCAPFASVHSPPLAAEPLARWNDAMARGSLGAALLVDPDYAEVHFRLALLEEAAGNLVEARRDYLMARDADALRFRADSHINGIIRAEVRAADSGVALVDAARDMGAAADSTGLPAGWNFFLEHVHLTWAGNYELARLLAAGVAAGFGPPARPWLSSEECAAAVGYTEFGHASVTMSMDRLTSRPPFTQQLNFAEARTRLLDEINRANRAVATPGALAAMAGAVAEARRQDPANTFLWFHEATIRAQLGDYGTALALNEQLAVREPAAPEDVAQRAYLLGQLGRADEAERLLLQSAAADPYYFQTYSLLGWLWGKENRRARAVEFFSDLAGRLPGNLAVLHTYADALAAAGDWTRAEAQWRAILRLVPDDEDALRPLCVRMMRDGRADAAIELMLAAHAYNPRSYANDARLEQVFESRGDKPRTIAFLRDLAASGPVNAQLFVDLARLQRESGQLDEAVASLRLGARRSAEAGDTAGLESIRRAELDLVPATP